VDKGPRHRDPDKIAMLHGDRRPSRHGPRGRRSTYDVTTGEVGGDRKLVGSHTDARVRGTLATLFRRSTVSEIRPRAGEPTIQRNNKRRILLLSVGWVRSSHSRSSPPRLPFLLRPSRRH